MIPTPYIYESHLGGLFTEDNLLTYEEEYCETCGDSDQLLGYANTKEEAWKFFKLETDIDDYGGYDYEDIKKFIEANFE